MTRTILELVRTYLDWRRQRADLRTLLDHDDRLLQDMGLRRADVEAALARPFDTDVRSEAFRLSHLSLQLDRLR